MRVEKGTSRFRLVQRQQKGAKILEMSSMEVISEARVNRIGGEGGGEGAPWMRKGKGGGGGGGLLPPLCAFGALQERRRCCCCCVWP